MRRPGAQYAAALAGLALGGALVLFAASRVWVRVSVARPSPLPPQVRVATGSSVAPVLTAAGLVLLAAIVAVLATKRVGRRLVGGLAALVAALGIVAAAPYLVGVPASAVADVDRTGTVVAGGSAEVAAWAPWTALVGSTLGVLAGLLVALVGPTWVGMGRRYDSPAADAPDGRPDAEDPADEPSAADRSAWAALDEGRDPT